MPKVSEAHLERRRQQILGAAIACFARKGFHQTTMADIADEAGVSDTLAYRYFSGKEELIEAAVRQHGDATVGDLLGASDGAEDFRTLVDLLIGTNLRRFGHLEEMKATMGMYFRAWAEALHDEKAREEVVDRWRHHFDIVEGLVRRAQEAEQISSRLEPRAVAWVMMATHYGSNLLAVLDPEIDLEKSKEVMLALVFGEFPAKTTKSDGTGNTIVKRTGG
ncbi:MAG TPA: TetR family transcriptional regulator [Acidimicrobiia bacterium]